MSRVFTIGEALIDWIPEQKGVGLKEVTAFSKAAGGAPANVACAVARLGGSSAFIGKLGEDAFGDFLVETMDEVGVDTTRVLRTGEANTAMAFVSLKEDGNREFSFYRSPSADMLLRPEEIGDWFAAGDVLHFCSVDLIDAPVKEAHRAAIAKCREAGGIVSFDPNVRLPLWPSPEACRRAILEFLPLARIVKISDEELAFITGIEDEEEALSSLLTGEVEHVVYTRGPAGATWLSRGFRADVLGHAVKAVDTTGAGDSFIGALLYGIHRRPDFRAGIDERAARELLAYANAAAAVTTTRPGAIAALPRPHEVEDMLAGSR
ncbi:carbohydrate kinase [Paenibacillus albicereus]|uniref:Carbohydrate kinase n=1 Tax=Paenibacillus albicereus TaxID=2726185 RepID=A0A6H2GU54_9BACL|nr:carbohydrate kinase [Paenibacillus albicereus]QJC50940.1 carbohydrate kinase [Paenibacillus albicereus]